MNIEGMGIVFNRGRGVPALERALEEGWRPPSGGFYTVGPETFSDKLLTAKARRADRFTRMALLAAADAFSDGGLAAIPDKSRIGVVLATALGPHATTFGFLDGILDFGDAAASPTLFSHSVHNAAASYIALTLEVRGPTLTLTDFHFAFHEAVCLADLWLDQGRCDAVLVGAADELGQVMQAIGGSLLKLAEDGRIRPLAFAKDAVSVPGEGSVFLALTRPGGPGRYGTLEAVPVGAEPEPGWTHGLLDADGMIGDETKYAGAAAACGRVGAYTPLFGSLMTGSAMHAAVAAVMMRNQKEYACPVADAGAELPVLTTTRPAAVGGVVAVRFDCAGHSRSLRIGR